MISKRWSWVVSPTFALSLPFDFEHVLKKQEVITLGLIKIENITIETSFEWLMIETFLVYWRNSILRVIHLNGVFCTGSRGRRPKRSRGDFSWAESLKFHKDLGNEGQLETLTQCCYPSDWLWWSWWHAARFEVYGWIDKQLKNGDKRYFKSA